MRLLELLRDAGPFALVILLAGLVAIGTSARAAWRSWTGRDVDAFRATAPFLALALAGTVASILDHAPPHPHTYMGDTRTIRVMAWMRGILGVPLVAYGAALPGALVLLLGMRGPAHPRPWRAVAVPAGCVAFVLSAPFVALGLDVDGDGGALPFVVDALAGVALLRHLRAPAATGTARAAAVAFAVIVGLGAAASVAAAQIGDLHAAAVLPADLKPPRFDAQRRDAVVLVALALLTSAVASLPARRLGVRHALWAPAMVACFTAASDPAPFLRTLVTMSWLEVAGFDPRPLAALPVSTCLPAPLATPSQPACP